MGGGRGGGAVRHGAVVAVGGAARRRQTGCDCVGELWMSGFFARKRDSGIGGKWLGDHDDSCGGLFALQRVGNMFFDGFPRFVGVFDRR